MPAPSNKPKPLDGTLQECGTIEGHICMRCRHDMKEHILDDIALEVSRMADDSNMQMNEPECRATAQRIAGMSYEGCAELLEKDIYDALTVLRKRAEKAEAEVARLREAMTDKPERHRCYSCGWEGEVVMLEDEPTECPCCGRCTLS